MAASVSHATILVEHENKLVEVLRGDSLLTTIRSALLDFVLQDDARDFEFKRLVGDVEAVVGESVFAAMKGQEGFRVKLVKKGVKRSIAARGEEEAEEIATLRTKLAISEGKRKMAEQSAHRLERSTGLTALQYPATSIPTFSTSGTIPTAISTATINAYRQAISEQNQRTIDDHLARLRNEEVAREAAEEDLEHQERLMAQDKHMAQLRDEQAAQEALEEQDGLQTQAAARTETTTTADAIKQEQPEPHNSQSHITITIKQMDGSEWVFKARKTTLMEKIYWAIAERTILCELDFELTSEYGRRLNRRSTVEESEIEDGAILYMHMQQKGGKPVIYLLPPSPLTKVSVKLSLIPQWEFSAIYPVVPATFSNGQQNLEWTVSAEPGGMLVNKADQQSTPYLYWEALTTGKATTSSLPFNPSAASLDPSNCLLLTLEDVVPHLQEILEELTLNVQARTDFITYWLPALNKHKHIALRFLPQQEYETAAPLSVEPQPDVVTRVFMLFRGIKDEDLSAWRNVEKEIDWQEVVGVTAAAEDEKVFRVLEWGGMEVKA